MSPHTKAEKLEFIGDKTESSGFSSAGEVEEEVVAAERVSLLRGVLRMSCSSSSPQQPILLFDWDESRREMRRSLVMVMVTVMAGVF